ncbi:MATE family efflux transporter [Haliea sp. E17]|uniref:MATE family efflux transporter n=1 Tax=Haliea sp. E17 TaxID=3401576 RepID=UPI003AAC56B3
MAISSNPGSDTGSTTLRVWQLAWPTIVSNLLLTTVQFAHIKIVSDLGSSSVAAVTTGHRVFFLLQAMMMGLSVAATALISRHWGAGNKLIAERAHWASMALCLLLSAVTTIPLLLFPSQVAGLFGLDAHTTQETARFIFWYGLFSVFISINLMLSTALRATGDVVTPLWFLFASVMLNVLLAYSFTYGALGLPALGVAGTAMGGGLAAAIPACIFVLSWWRGNFKLGAVKRWAIDRTQVRQLVQIGTPSVLEQGFIQIAMLGFFLFLGHYGTAAYAAYGIGISIVSFSLVVAFSFGLATATLVGQHLGAQRPDLARTTGWRGLAMAVTTMCVLSVPIAIYAQDLARFMIPDEETVQLTKVFIYFIALSQPIMAIEITLGSALRGAGDTRFPLISTVIGMVAGRIIPAAIFVSLGMSVYWMFAVTLFDYGIKAVLMLLRYSRGHWQHVRIGS